MSAYLKQEAPRIHVGHADSPRTVVDPSVIAPGLETASRSAESIPVLFYTVTAILPCFVHDGAILATIGKDRCE